MQISEAPVHISTRPGKKTPGCRDTHGTHGDTGTRGHTDHTDETHNQANPHQRTRQLAPAPGTARPRDDRIRGRLNSRSPGADRSPRPTQKRPPPANPTLPPPAPKLKNTGGSRDTHWTHGKHRSRRRTSHPTPVPTPAARLVHPFTTHQNVQSQAFTCKTACLTHRPRSQQSAPMIVIASVQSASRSCQIQ
jgi:hypothetical protein